MTISDDKFTAYGGCRCRAVRFEVDVPELAERPFQPISNEKVRLPMALLCHCNDCRTSTGQLGMAGLMIPIERVRVSLLPRSSPSVADKKTDDDPASRSWRAAAEVFNPNSPPADSFLMAFKATKETARTFCGRCGTTLAVSMYPMPESWPTTLTIHLGTFDRGDIEKYNLVPERHVMWNLGIKNIQQMYSEIDSLPKHHLDIID